MNRLRNLQNVLSRFNQVQKFMLSTGATVLLSLTLFSVVPAVLFTICFFASVILANKLTNVNIRINEKYIFAILDFIEKVEDFVIKSFKRPVTNTDSITNKNQKVTETSENVAKVCIQYVVRDFINSWYKESISQENQIIEEAHNVLENFTQALFEHLQKVEIFPIVIQIIKTAQKHIHDYKAAEKIFQQQKFYAGRKRSKENIDMSVIYKRRACVSSVFKHEKKIHIAMKSEEGGVEYLRAVAAVVLQSLMSESIIKCDSAKELILEILTVNILENVMDLFTDPFWLHKTMILILSDKELLWIDNKHNQNSSSSENKLDSQEVNDSHTFIQVQPSINSQIIEDGDNLLFANNDINISSTIEALNMTSSLSEVETDTQSSFFIGDDTDLRQQTVDTNLMTTKEHELGKREEPEGSDVTKCKEMIIDVPSMSASHPDSLNTVFDSAISREPVMAATSCDNLPNESLRRKELYLQRNKPLDTDDALDDINREDADSIGSLSSLSSNVTFSPLTQSTPNLALKIEYGPDISNIDPAALIKETPRNTFAGIHIPKTEVVNEANGIYTLYLIEFVAWHFLPNVSRWTQQPSSVRRRFREFVTLNERLEEHPTYRKSMKGIKGPRRWTLNPLGIKKEKDLEYRRKFLEQYLQSLVRHKDVGNSFALREFLAYEADRSIAFVKKASEMPRIDKVIARTFSGMFKKILPATTVGEIEEKSNQPSQIKKVESKPELISVDTSDNIESGDENALDIRFGFWYPEDQDEAYNNIESILSKTAYHTDDPCEDNLKSETDSLSEFKDPIETILPIKRSDGDGCDVDALEQKLLPEDLDMPLSTSVLNIALQLAETIDSYVCYNNVLHMIKMLAARALNSFLIEEIGELTSPPELTNYLTKLKKVIWPHGQLDTSEEIPPSEEQKKLTREQAKQALIDFFPVALPVIVGIEDFNQCANIVMECLDHPELNRSLAFSLVDLLVESIFLEIKVPNFQHELLKRMCHS